MTAVSSQTKWKQYFQGMTGSRDFIETTTLVHTKDGNVRAWTKAVGPNDDTKGTLSLLEINCKERTYIVRSLMALGEAEEALHSALEKVQAQWREKEEWDYIGLSDRDLLQYQAFCSSTPRQTAKR